VCLVTGRADTFPLALSVPYPVFIGYFIDDITYMRQTISVQQIQSIDPLAKPTGVDVRALFYQESTPAPSPNQLAMYL
jgi:hypothetical protein